MNKSEKRKLKDRNRRLKQQRKAQLNAEKRSIRKQKKELNNIKRKHNRRHGKSSWWSAFIRIFKNSGNKNPHHHHKRPPGLFKRIILWYKESKSFSRNRKEAKRKQKQQAKIRARMIIKEKSSRRNERKHLRDKTRPMRRKIREARFRHFKEQFAAFIRQPIKVRKLKEEEKILRKHIKEDIRWQRRQAVQQIPDAISSGLSGKIRMQREKFRFLLMYLNSIFSGRFVLKRDPGIRKELLKTLINSVVLYILAFLIIYFSSKLVTIFVAGLYDIPAVLYSYRIFWPLYTYSSLYTRQALILIFASGPLFSLAAGLLVYRIFVWLRFKNLNFKLLLLWIYFHALNLFFGAYISGVITRTGFVYTTEWLFYSQIFDVEEIVFMIISIIILLVVGFYLARKFIIASTSKSIVDPGIRLFYMLASVMFPWLFGSGFLYFLNFPQNPPELMLLYASTILMVFPALTNFNSIGNKAVKVVLNKQGVKIAWIYILVTIVIVIAIRMIAFNGISFR